MKLKKILRPKTGKEIPFLIFISFLGTFIASRTFTFLFPDFFVPIRGNHIHHFAYGLFLLIFLCYFLLTQPRSSKTRLKFAIIYGISLGLAMDEFAMWIQLENNYYDRSNYDAILITSLVFINVVYFESFWKKWGYRLGSLIKKITR